MPSRQSTLATIAKAEGKLVRNVRVDSEVDMNQQSGHYHLAVRLSVRAEGVDTVTLEGLVESEGSMSLRARHPEQRRDDDNARHVRMPRRARRFDAPCRRVDFSPSMSIRAPLEHQGGAGTSAGR